MSDLEVSKDTERAVAAAKAKRVDLGIPNYISEGEE
jgi:hypothetical protein